MFLFPSQGSRIQLSSAFSFNHPRSLAPDPGQSSTRLTSLSWFFVNGEHEFSPVEAPLQTIFLKFLFRTSPDNSPHLAAVLTPVCWCPASVAPFLSSCLSTAIVPPPRPRGPLVFWERRPRDSRPRVLRPARRWPRWSDPGVRCAARRERSACSLRARQRLN